MTDLKLGALEPQRPYGLSTLGTYAVGKLPLPPASSPEPKVSPWGMFLNDKLGDCTIAGVAHAILAWNAEVGVNDHVPTDDEVDHTYMSLTGGADSGLVEALVLRKWHQDGLFGCKITGYAPVEPHNFTELHQSIAFYGGAYLGIACPQSAQEQFQNHEEWVVVPGSPIEGGHCIHAVGYDQYSVQCVTWGGIAHISYPWLQRYLTEAWAILPHQFLEAGHGPTLDLATLQADLSQV